MSRVIVQDHMEKNMDNQMETGVLVSGLGFWV